MAHPVQSVLTRAFNELGEANNYTAPPKERLLLRLKPGMSSLQREGVQNGLRPLLEEGSTSFTDILGLLDTTMGTVTLLMLFFYVVATVACLLCFFILWTSFDAMIRESLWELGVLRSLGLTHAELTRSFLYESFASISAALILGTITGLSVAVTLTAQQSLFTELPFKFVFPSGLFGLLVGATVFVAIGGAYFPSQKLQEKPIATVLKGK